MKNEDGPIAIFLFFAIMIMLSFYYFLFNYLHNL